MLNYQYLIRDNQHLIGDGEQKKKTEKGEKRFKSNI